MTGIAVLAMAVSAVVAAPAMADPGTANGKRTLPTFTGSVTDGTDNFNATVAVKEIAKNSAGDLVATEYDYNITGDATESGSVDVGRNNPLALPMDSNRGSRCTILHLDLAPLFLDLLGL